MCLRFEKPYFTFPEWMDKKASGRKTVKSVNVSRGLSITKVKKEKRELQYGNVNDTGERSFRQRRREKNSKTSDPFKVELELRNRL